MVKTYSLTWKPDRTQIKRPIFLSILQLLEQDIQSGRLAAGTKLPSQRDLADYLGVNFTTITRAYRQCRMKGLVYAVGGSGTFVSAGFGMGPLNAWEDPPHTCIDLGHDASFQAICASSLKGAVKSTLEGCNYDLLLAQRGDTGQAALKAAVLNWLAQFGLRFQTSQMIMVSGTRAALNLVLLALFEPGQQIAVDQFTYAYFIDMARLCQIQLAPILGDDQGMLPEDLEKHCRQSKIAAVYLMPTCSNPTAAMISKQRKAELAAVIRKNQLILIEDDTYCFLKSEEAQADDPPLFHLNPERSVFICSPSQAICTSLQSGCLVCGESLQSALERVNNAACHGSVVDAEIIKNLILSGKANEIMAAKRRLAAEANQLFNTVFPDAPRGGNPLSHFRWLPLADEHEAKRLETSLQRRGIHAFHSDRFSAGGGAGGHALRICLASTGSMQELKDGLDLLKSALADYDSSYCCGYYYIKI